MERQSIQNSKKISIEAMKEVEETKKQKKKNSCPYFPCHEDMEDCKQCYCDFYLICPNISQGILGGYWLTRADGSKVWACEKCNYVHKKKIANHIKKNPDNLSKAELLKQIIEMYKQEI